LAKARKILNLDCRGSAAGQVALVLQTRLEEMCAQRDRALDWTDPEGVHDMRVASRRLRSAIADLKPYLHRRSLPKRELRAIARSLGMVRDQDVAVPVLEELKAKAGGTVAEGIEALAEERRRQQLDARAALEQAISSKAVAGLRDELFARLKIAGRASAKDEPTLRQVGVEVITSRLKQFTAGADCIYHPQMSKELHELRILAKRLRYAVELFTVCWGDELRQLAKEIGRLQTSLGELHDCDEWIDDIGSRLRKSKRAKDPATHESEAAVWLLRHFTKERTDHYRDALARWHAWERDGFLSELRHKLRTGSTKDLKVMDVAPPNLPVRRQTRKKSANKN